MNIETALNKIRAFKLRIILPLVALILLIIACGFLYYFNLYGVRGKVDELIHSRLDSSSVSVSLNGSNVNFKFNITPHDRANFDQYLAKIGVGSFGDQFSVGIDDTSRNQLQKILPADLRLKVSANSLSFSNQYIKSLESGMLPDGYDLATGSGVLHYSTDHINKFDLSMTSPEDLAVYASESGKLRLSPKIVSMFSLLKNIATINLNVNQKSISGQIDLK